MTGGPLRVRLILDRSALSAYAAGSMHVAEPINQVVENGACVGVPAVAAAACLAHINDPADRAILLGLLNSGTCALLDSRGGDWLELEYWLRATGRLDLAACVLAVIEHDGWILTADSGLYGGGVPVIDIKEG